MDNSKAIDKKKWFYWVKNCGKTRKETEIFKKGSASPFSQ